MGLQLDFNQGSDWGGMSPSMRKTWAKTHLSEEDYNALSEAGEFGSPGFFGSTFNRFGDAVKTGVDTINKGVGEIRDTAKKAPPKQPQGQDPNLDLNTPGWGEQFWANNQGFAGQNHTAQAAEDYSGIFRSPTASEQLWQQRGAGPMENRSDQVFDSFDSSGPDFGAYYDNAYDRGSRKLNNQLTSRGQYGSSVGGSAMADFTSGLEAERANRESDFMAQRQRDRANIAGQADQVELSNLLGQSNLAGQATEGAFGRAKGGMGLASLLDENERADFSTGMTAATNAQGLKEGRVRGGYQDMLGMGSATSGLTSSALGGLFDRDIGLQDDEIAAMLGITTEQLRQIKASQQNSREGLGSIFSMIGSFYGGGGGMGGGGGGGSSQLSLPNTTWAGGGTGGGGVTPQDLGY